MDNSYEPPLVSDQDRESLNGLRPGWPTVRFVLYTHLTGIALTAGFAYADVHGIQLPQFVELIGIVAALGSFFVCPVLMLFALTWSNAKPQKKFGLFVLEGMLVAAHFFVLLPAVM